MTTSRIKVLVVDNDPSMRNVLKCSLELIGHNVSQAATGKDAIGLCREAQESGSPIDLILIDLYTTGDDTHILKRVRAITPAIKIAVMGDSIDNGELRRTNPYGFNGALRKPFGFQEFQTEIARILSLT